jgi:hypothetical protein
MGRELFSNIYRYTPALKKNSMDNVAERSKGVTIVEEVGKALPVL